ncbi:MAG: response regulator transcription factor [Gaiellales bacterium]
MDRRMKVVLVDDDGGFAESLRKMVEDQPELSVVGVASDGLEALDLVEQAAPQAVLIDLHMPLLDGVSAIARLRQDHPSLCLIAITGDGAPELHRAVEEAGADAVLMKHDLADALAPQIVAVRESVSAR